MVSFPQVSQPEPCTHVNILRKTVHLVGFIYKSNFDTCIENVAMDMIKAALLALAKPFSVFHHQNLSQSQFRVIPASSAAISRSSFTQKRVRVYDFVLHISYHLRAF